MTAVPLILALALGVLPRGEARAPGALARGEARAPGGVRLESLTAGAPAGGARLVSPRFALVVDPGAAPRTVAARHATARPAADPGAVGASPAWAVATRPSPFTPWARSARVPPPGVHDPPLLLLSRALFTPD